MATQIKMKCTKKQNKAETVFYFYPELELVTLADASAFKIGVRKLLNAYNRRISKGEDTSKFSVFDEFENEYLFEEVK